jgi:hypothetical protein
MGTQPQVPPTPPTPPAPPVPQYSKAKRIELIEAIQKERGTRVITYVTSTRQNLETQMAMDSIRKIYDHLQFLKEAKKDAKVDLFLHSNGGDGTVPWRLVTLIREHADKFAVLVPHKAFSAATLTALGAHEIVMHRMGMLGPPAPTVQNSFNPEDPQRPGQRLGISVEDVTAYIALIKEDAGIQHEDELVQAFKILADKVHHLALGNVKRSLSQSRMMARKLLALHMGKSDDEHAIEEIVDSLTSKLFYHGHPINRKEARDQVGLKTIADPSSKVEELMWDLYLQYESEMKLEEPFNQALEFVAQMPPPIPATGATTPPTTVKTVYIESVNRTDLFKTEYELKGVPAAVGGIQTQMLLRKTGWELE